MLDLKLKEDPGGDLAVAQSDPNNLDSQEGWVYGAKEIAQRVRTRIKRQYGEWFLARKEGVPWFSVGDEESLLSVNQLNQLKAFITLVVRETAGVNSSYFQDFNWDSQNRVVTGTIILNTPYGVDSVEL